MHKKQRTAAAKTKLTPNQFDLEEHLVEEHTISPFTTYIKEIVYGGTDGIITTFAIVAGFAGAQANPTSQLPLFAILLFGFANLFADGISMALGNFMSTRSEQDVYKHAKQQEYQEILHNSEMEKAETLAILLDKGFTKKQAADLVAIYATNPAYWTDFMMNHELELSNPEGDNPLFMALATFFSFLIFGFIPLAPYVLLWGTSDVYYFYLGHRCGTPTTGDHPLASGQTRCLKKYWRSTVVGRCGRRHSVFCWFIFPSVNRTF